MRLDRKLKGNKDIDRVNPAMDKWNPSDCSFPIWIIKQVHHWQIYEPQQDGHDACDYGHESKSLD
jgi:hypothetical protein